MNKCIAVIGDKLQTTTHIRIFPFKLFNKLKQIE